jgi:hypothetical protein
VRPNWGQGRSGGPPRTSADRLPARTSRSTPNVRSLASSYPSPLCLLRHNRPVIDDRGKITGVYALCPAQVALGNRGASPARRRSLPRNSRSLHQAGVDQASPVGHVGRETALAYPATDRSGTPAHSLSRFGNRKHETILRPHADGAARDIERAAAKARSERHRRAAKPSRNSSDRPGLVYNPFRTLTSERAPGLCRASG